MRVCQFRHFGTHVKSSTDDWTGSLSSVAKALPGVKRADIQSPGQLILLAMLVRVKIASAESPVPVNVFQSFGI
jgi:hypothetical protein